MKYGDAAAFRQSLEQRLATLCEGDGARIARERKRVAFDRLLARLVDVAPGRWILKGGFALDLRSMTRARATKDVDIEWCDRHEKLVDVLLDAASHDPGDFFTFGIERAGAPADRLGGSERFRVAVSLAGRPFETFFLDVGFRSGAGLKTQKLHTDGLLEFAGIPPVEVDAVSPELQAAEKLHAYTRIYEGGRPSTRVKDLVDLVLLAERASIDTDRLRREIETIFTLRGTHKPPEALPVPSSDWRVPFRRMAEEVDLPPELGAGYQAAAAYFDPILSGIAGH